MPKPFNSWARSMKEDIARRLRENEEVRGYNGSTVLRERERERERDVFLTESQTAVERVGRPDSRLVDVSTTMSHQQPSRDENGRKTIHADSRTEARQEDNHTTLKAASCGSKFDRFLLKYLLTDK